MKVPHFYKKALLIDIDGTVVKHALIENQKTGKIPKALKNAVKWVNKKFEEGYGIYFFTSRLCKEKEATEAMLDKHGFKYHQVIFGKPYAERTIIIDDRKFDAIQVERNIGVNSLSDEDLE